MLIKLKRANCDNNTVEWACFDMFSKGLVKGMSGIIVVECDVRPNELESLAFFKMIQINDNLRRHIGISGRVNISFSDQKQANYFLSPSMSVYRDLICPDVNVLTSTGRWECSSYSHTTVIDNATHGKIIFKSPLIAKPLMISTDLLSEIEANINRRKLHPKSIIRLIDNNLKRQVKLIRNEDDRTYLLSMKSIGISLLLRDVEENSNTAYAKEVV